MESKTAFSANSQVKMYEIGKSRRQDDPLCPLCPLCPFLLLPFPLLFYLTLMAAVLLR